MSPKYKCPFRYTFPFVCTILIILGGVVNDLAAQESSSYTFDSTFVSKQLINASIAKRKGDLDSMRYYAKSALETIGKDTLSSPTSTAYTLLGMIYRQEGKLDSCSMYYERSVAISKAIDDTLSLSKGYNNLGNVQHIQGNFENALGYYLESLELKELLKDDRGIAMSHHNVASIKLNLKDWDGAIEAFKKSQLLARKVEHEELIQRNLLKMAIAYRENSDFDTAITFAKEGLERAKASGNKRNIATGYYELGETFTLKNLIELASENYRLSLDVVREIKHIGYESAVLTSLGKLYVKNVEINNGKLSGFSSSEMESILLRAKELAEQSKSMEAQLQALESLQHYYRVEGEYKNQAQSQTAFLVLRDSIYNKERSEATVKQETLYKTAEKEKEIIQLEAAKEIAEVKNKALYRSLIGAILFFIALGFSGMQYLKQKNEKERLKEAERFRSKLSSDLHDDVGSMLSSLSMQTEVLGLSATPQQLERMEKITLLSREAMSKMRDTVWAIDARKDTMESLVVRMQDFLADTLSDHSNLTYEMNYSINSKDEILPSIRQNIYLIFKEAVTNASKYSNGNTLEVELVADKSNLMLQVKDNGVVDIDKVKNSGTGLSNFKLRTERINAKLELSFADGCKVKVDCPL